MNLEEIKKIKWELRVTRSGFLQSKGIINEAETQEIKLTRNVNVKYDNIFWIQDFNLYDDEKTRSFYKEFDKAFNEDKDWPLGIANSLDKKSLELDIFLQKINTLNWNEKTGKEKINYFLEYVNFLKSIQKYYAIAVPLVNYSEKLLEEVDPKDAVSYRKLEISNISQSKNTLKEFAWLKTAYNIIEELREDEIENINKGEEIFERQKSDNYLINTLQIGIYLRNRMKELSQKLWYYIDPLAISMAIDLGISREEFFTITYKEVIESYKNKNVVISKKEIEDRKKGFSIGILDNKEVIITGPDSLDLVDYFTKLPDFKEISGRVAYKGKVKGIVKTIFKKEQFKDFKKGDILVTTMTTPDYIVLIQKASAIVTDEGGLSCHAAIVSREMKKPCIIGTKIATKVLHDGDFVEVDAEKGIVKKI